MASEEQMPLPSQFGRYTLIQRLAAGGMAEVFRAKIVAAHGFEKVIVIKRILPHLAADDTFVTMFIDEAKLTARLTHPKIVQVLDFGEVAGQYFIALEFVDGYDALALLRAAAEKSVRIPLSLVIFIVAEILDALEYAHAATDGEGRPMRLVHRDISPSNIFISRHGDVKLGDFGIAHASDRESQTQAGTLKGKYGYMSPEQVTGAALDHRSDLFAVGIVLAEAFMGRRLFTARNELDVLLMVRDGTLDRLNRYGHDLPPELDHIVRKALKRDVGARYQTAAEFREALFDYLFTQKLRVGAGDLRAFMTDVFDPSPQAAARVKAQARALSVALPSTPPATDANRVAAHAARAAAVPAAVPRAVARSAGAQAVVASASPGPDVPAPTPIAGAPGSSLAEALAAREFALIDLDQWDASDQHSLERGTGWTPISASPGGSPPTPVDRDHQAVPEGAASARRLGATTTPNNLGRFLSAAPVRPPDSAGDLRTISAMRVFADVTVAGETGLLRFERQGGFGGQAAGGDDGLAQSEIKEVFLSAGAPESINSSLSSDRFGNYLVSRGVLRPPQLEQALAMLPRYSGKLGDTLVGLGLMRPLEVFRQLSQQVRDRVIDLFRWTDGNFAFFRGVRNEQESFPLGLDGFEILGAGILTVPASELERRFSSLVDARPTRTERRQIDPASFHLGPTPGEVLALLDGERTLRSWTSQFTSSEERATFLRSLYLLIETDLAELD